MSEKLLSRIETAKEAVIPFNKIKNILQINFEGHILTSNILLLFFF